jgi:Flp pilus assembly pilin Flp
MEEAIMTSITGRLVRFLRQEEGVTAVECALMLALVVIICIVAINPVKPENSAGEPVVVQVCHNN